MDIYPEYSITATVDAAGSSVGGLACRGLLSTQMLLLLFEQISLAVPRCKLMMTVIHEHVLPSSLPSAVDSCRKISKNLREFCSTNFRDKSIFGNWTKSHFRNQILAPLHWKRGEQKPSYAHGLAAAITTGASSACSFFEAADPFPLKEDAFLLAENASQTQGWQCLGTCLRLALAVGHAVFFFKKNRPTPEGEGQFEGTLQPGNVSSRSQSHPATKSRGSQREALIRSVPCARREILHEEIGGRSAVKALRYACNSEPLTVPMLELMMICIQQPVLHHSVQLPMEYRDLHHHGTSLLPECWFDRFEPWFQVTTNLEFYTACCKICDERETW